MISLPQADQSVSFSCPCHVSVAALFSPLPSVLALLQQLPLPTNNTGNHSINIECHSNVWILLITLFNFLSDNVLLQVIFFYTSLFLSDYFF